MLIRVSELIDQSPVRRPQILIILLCALVTLLDGVDIQAMSVSGPAIAREWNIGPSLLGTILSSTFAGITLGALSFGLLGDRVGRRGVLLGAFLLVGLATLASALATTPGVLLVLRFLTGVGIGGALPNATALTAEYMPAAKRTFLVTLMYCGVPLGSSLVAFVAPILIHSHGWRAIFVMGGALPLLLCGVIALFLPESVRFMLHKGQDPARIGSVLGRVLPGYVYSPGDTFDYGAPQARPATVRQLFTPERIAVTVGLWTIFFCSFFGFYLLTSWLPVIFTRASWPPDVAVRTVMVFQLGTVIGGIACGWLADRVGSWRVLAISYFCASVLVAAIGAADNVFLPTMLLVIAAGIFLGGPQVAIVAVSANAYPTLVRSTGVGWALGAGRIGAIVSPIAAGFALSAKWPAFAVFLLAALPALVCGLMALMLALRGRKPLILSPV